LCLFAARDRETTTRSFLEVLSFDELLFLAEFVGSCILIRWTGDIGAWDVICQRSAIFRNASPEEGHKLMVLTEFAARCGVAMKFRQSQEFLVTRAQLHSSVVSYPQSGTTLSPDKVLSIHKAHPPESPLQ
jgi:hypothetical protein